MWTKAFWKALFERAIIAAAASLGSAFSANGMNLLNVSWTDSLAVAGMAGLVVILLGLGAGISGPTNGPSFGPETLTATVVAVQDRDTNVGAVAGDASNLANGTPVDVLPAADAPAPPNNGAHREAGATDIGTVVLIGILALIALAAFGVLPPR